MPRALPLVLCLLAASSTVARGDSAAHWTEVRSPHFTVVTDSDEKQGRRIAGQFERMRSLFQGVLPYASFDAGQPITVLALRDRRGFQALEPAAYTARGSLDLAGSFLRTQDRNYILLRLDTTGEHPFSTVYHEYTHFILRKAEWMPLWLNEGLAEFYQNTDIGEKEVRLGQPSSDDLLYLREHSLIPLPVLFAVDHNSPFYHEEQKGSIFYSESWALTHFLEITDFDNKTQHLQAYAKLVAANGDPVGSAQLAFGDLDVLTKQLGSYIHSSTYKLFSVHLAVASDEGSYTARPLSTPQADSLRADVLANNERVAEARALIETVLRDDPKDPLAHESMGYIALREHDETAAARWFGEAVDLGSDSPFAFYYYASTLLESGVTGKDEAIESDLREAIRLDPGFAPSYEALGRFYAERRRNLEEASQLMSKAAQLEPEEMAFRINMANIYMQRGLFDAAVRVLTIAARAARDPQQKAIIEARLADIQQTRQTQPTQEPRSKLEGAVQSSGPLYVTVLTDPAPMLPVVAASAPRHTAHGVLRNVRCSYPSVLTLELEQQPGRSLTFFSPDMYRMTFSTRGFTMTNSIDPCTAFAGMKAEVEYAEVSDDTLAGQMLAVELSR